MKQHYSISVILTRYSVLIKDIHIAVYYYSTCWPQMFVYCLPNDTAITFCNLNIKSSSISLFPLRGFILYTLLTCAITGDAVSEQGSQGRSQETNATNSLSF